MSLSDILGMIGGLALFLYGMNAMGEGLSKTAGSRLEKILEKLTSTPIRGVLLGMVVTAVIQSSSATTVMVVGFVNSGIMNLSQAVGIIMGANVGTTITRSDFIKSKINFIKAGYILFYFFLCASRSGKKNCSRNADRTLYALRMIVGYLCGGFC